MEMVAANVDINCGSKYGYKLWQQRWIEIIAAKMARNSVSKD